MLLFYIVNNKYYITTASVMTNARIYVIKMHFRISNGSNNATAPEHKYKQEMNCMTYLYTYISIVQNIRMLSNTL